MIPAVDVCNQSKTIDSIRYDKVFHTDRPLGVRGTLFFSSHVPCFVFALLLRLPPHSRRTVQCLPLRRRSLQPIVLQKEKNISRRDSKSLNRPVHLRGSAARSPEAPIGILAKGRKYNKRKVVWRQALTRRKIKGGVKTETSLTAVVFS